MLVFHLVLGRPSASVRPQMLQMGERGTGAVESEWVRRKINRKYPYTRLVVKPGLVTNHSTSRNLKDKLCEV